MSDGASAIMIRMRGASFARSDGSPALHNIDWELRAGDSWAVIGPTGGGKTTFAEAVLGRLQLTAGSIEWPGLPDGPTASCHLLAFREESWQFSYARHYYQQRFNFIEPHDDLTLDEFLRSGVTASEDQIRSAAFAVGIHQLFGLSLIKLSNGQMRRARIARTLLRQPRVLILDQPFVGLDESGREDVSRLLGDLAARGQAMVLITDPQEVPDWVTQVLQLDAGAVQRTWARCDYTTPALSAGKGQVGDNVIPPNGMPIVELRDVTVRYGERVILDSVNWTVRQGERWAVLGPNGCGKSTLLSLLTADHPQAYANDVRLFGVRRGNGESIWEVKRRLGFVSPELCLYFNEPLTACEAVATGFHDVLVKRPISPDRESAVRERFHRHGMAHLVNRPFARLSTGEQRFVLLQRALVKAPPLLILDEPFQGMDDELMARLRDGLDADLRPDQSLLFVTHRPHELPSCVNRIMRPAMPSAADSAATPRPTGSASIPK